MGTQWDALGRLTKDVPEKWRYSSALWLSSGRCGTGVCRTPSPPGPPPQGPASVRWDWQNSHKYGVMASVRLDRSVGFLRLIDASTGYRAARTPYRMLTPTGGLTSFAFPSRRDAKRAERYGLVRAFDGTRKASRPAPLISLVAARQNECPTPVIPPV